MERPLRSVSKQAGFSLIGVLMAMGITSTLFLAISELFNVSQRAQRSMEYRSELLGLKTRMMFEVDCQDSMTGITDPATQCTPTNYITLRNKSGAIMGGPLVTSGIFINSRRLEGPWFVRATCDNTSQTFVIRLAREGPTPTQFGKDPQLDFEYDWNHPRGLLFGPEAKICGQAFMPPGDPPPAEPPPADPPPPSGGPGAWAYGTMTNTGSACTMSINRDDDGNPVNDARIWSGSVNCPSGSVTGGTVDCRPSNLRHAYTISSGVSGNGWRGACCIFTGATYSGTNKVMAYCQ